MNIRKNSAGFVTKKHILKRGFKVFDIIEGFDYSMPQYQNDKMQILGGYWNYVVKDIKTGNKLWEGWWNSNDEFDKTISKLNHENGNDAKGRLA
jgi:hypothetical protein